MFFSLSFFILKSNTQCVKGYLAQSDLVGNQLMNIVSSFVNSHASLVVEGVHLNINIMLKVVQTFPNVVPFLIYIKKEDFHRQRFAVRAKYMTTDPSANRYISNFSAIRYVQTYLSKGANKHLVPKIDNRNIDRSLETIHQTLFSYLKKLEGRNSMYDPSTERLTFLDSVWRRRKQKLASKAKTLKTIRALKGEFLNNSNNANNNPTNSTNNNETNGENLAILHQQQQDSLEELMSSLPTEGEQINKEESDDTEDVDVIKYLRNGTMILSHEKIVQSKPKVEKKETEEKDEFQHWPMYKTDSQMEFADGDTDIAEVTLTDFVETTDSEYTDLSSILINLKDRQQQLQPPSQS
ncbi:hypothetical protein TRFO_28235 [Tritrichomonas foetus]|uniref:Zeta toxin domain-containing protein n=1 Tax=Tritrichomonas foetus TaxID=1144522 RepID=A0A1J4K0L0_9EUKA|nr:hypothetical protein TRFO_28235 [Tritrichomonas foetus]|eukprot:OHT04296.1 hypothetical protein TRFO_28235 [Tritrichomonas foetus]